MDYRDDEDEGGGRRVPRDKWRNHKRIFMVIAFLSGCVVLHLVFHLHDHLPKKKHQHKESHKRWLNVSAKGDGGWKKWKEEQIKAGVDISKITKSGWKERHAKDLGVPVEEVERELAGGGKGNNGAVSHDDKAAPEAAGGGGENKAGGGGGKGGEGEERRGGGGAEASPPPSPAPQAAEAAALPPQNAGFFSPLPPDIRNPVVLELSQGRSGSTITGNLVLKSHTYCGQFIDELIWVVYRLFLAKETDKDQMVSIDYFLNTTQCNLQPKVWEDFYSKDWLYKREAHSEGENTTLTREYFSRASQYNICMGLHKSTPPKAMCSKELRFLGHVRPLMLAASQRRIPLTLIYQLRDPRATVFSQIWTFHRGDHTVDIGVYSIRKLRSACRIGISDLEAIRDVPPGVQAMEICFEDLIHRPQLSLKNLYSSIEGFRTWPYADPETLLPPETEAYGREHINHWDDAMQSANLTEEERRAGQGNVWVSKRSYDRYSSEKSRSDHVHVWKEAWPFIKYDGMRQVWDKDPNCVALRKISKCAHLWPAMPLNETARNIMYSSWGKVPLSDLDNPNSWISKAKQLKIAKSMKMLEEADRLDALGDVDAEAEKEQLARWQGGEEKEDDDEGKGKRGPDGHSAHWHQIHDTNGTAAAKAPHPKHVKSTGVLAKKEGVLVEAGEGGGAEHKDAELKFAANSTHAESKGMGRRGAGGGHPMKKRKKEEGGGKEEEGGKGEV